ncbi:MFS transporter [Arthrobacter sp. MYb23]|uniref:MFS transporter n=1 Tax=unclassified Arthrobacter TaxID=235627 RepID=UPI000CFBE856|nr:MULTISPECIES: MFS transporter [unclassified Arthrobacter]PRB41081.1 MFS transporter [Arthrobacter sp. MYb51]PRB94751.1 MFS transporter [Arthrobacter sp. MYb23]
MSHRTSPQGVLALSAATLALFSYSALETAISPALPSMMDFYGVPAAVIVWAFTALLLVGAVATPVIGRLSDVADTRWVLVGVLLAVSLGVLLSAVAPTIELFITGQALQGIGLALIPLSVKLVSSLLPPNAAKIGNGMIITIATAATALGFLVSGPLLDLLGFRGLYWITLAILLPSAVLALFTPKIAATAGSRIDFAGAFFLALAAGGTMLAIAGARSWELTSPQELLTITAAAIGVIGLIVVERRHENPVVDFALMRTRPIAGACTVAFGVGFSTFSAYVLLPILITMPTEAGGLGGTATTTGLLLLPLGALGAIAAPFAGHLERLVGARIAMLIGTGTIAASSLLLAVGFQSIGLIVVAMVLIGIGIGLALTQLLNVAISAAPSDRQASVSGLSFVIKSISGSLGALIGGLVISAVNYAPSGFTTAFVIAAVVSVLTMGAAFMLPRSNLAVTPSREPVLVA